MAWQRFDLEKGVKPIIADPLPPSWRRLVAYNRLDVRQKHRPALALKISNYCLICDRLPYQQVDNAFKGNMDTGNVSAIISAVSGISGVLLGNSFVAIKEFLINRTKRRKETAYLAIIVVSHLDRFASGCLNVALDDGTAYGRPAGANGEEYSPTVTLPEFQPLDLGIEWKVLPQNLMYSILRLPDQREQIQNRLAGITEFDDDYPDHTEYFWARRRDYAELGLRTSELARCLRTCAGMSFEEPKPGEWCRDQELRDVIKKIDDARDAYERRRLARPYVI